MSRKGLAAVAMSGGVDSSVAAALLKEEGYEVIGITMCFNFACCSRAAIEDARRVAHKLGIRHYVLNMQKALDEYVIKDFCRQYLRGRTPNPCVRCNQYIKFGRLLKKASSLGAKYLATGHYARIEEVHSPQSTVYRKRYLLKKAKDRKKDQSYFLYRLNQGQLRQILFPLGNYTKEQVRKLAVKFGLAVADKPDSQEICFLPGKDYREFLAGQAKDKIKPGPIVDGQGNILGEHRGIAFYTIGQRQGLGIARGFALYITAIDSRKNQLVAGRKEEAEKSEFLVDKAHFIFKKPKKKIAVKVKIRYNHQEASALVWPFGRRWKACFKKPQFAITSGQSAVFYDKEVVLGGGIINRALE
ncbi:MAG: tRNA 2-thiouridine(34) synthase MnmA [Candidatus Omnitrophota bacterium]